MMAADSLHVAVHLVVPSGVPIPWLSACRRACSASADPSYRAPHFALHSHVQASCLERARPMAVAAFAGALAARAAAPPGRRCPERQRGAKAEGKTKGCGTCRPAKPVCTWGWRATKPGSPYLYRLDCVRMHAEWLAYCEAGIDYLRERVFPWWTKNLNGDGTIKSRNLEGFFGAAVYYGVGSWACQTLGGTTLHPIYTKFDAPTGRFREEMKTSNLYPGSVSSGGFLPILAEPTKGFQNCMGTIYHRNPAIYDTLNALQKRQRHNLKYSLVSAYVRRTDAAFAGDDVLLTLLDDMRALLLKSEARMAINMLDVPEGERHNGKDWRAQLLASGVPKVPSRFGIKARLSAGDGKPDEPEPDVPPLRVGNPVPPAWEDPPVRRGRQDRDAEPAVMGDQPPALWTRERAVVAGIGGFGALFAAGWALSKVYKRKSGPL